MALRDLQTNLKSLRVDKDRPFGGSSGLPYIKGGLPEDSPAGEYLADLARYSSEGTVRGGLFSIVSSATDSVRVSRFLNDFPKGLLFTSKQIGLQRSNPKIETGTRGDVLNTQVYSNSNLLAQIALQGTGEHVPRPGFNTNDLLREENKYEKIVSNKSTDENRLVTLYNNKILPPTGKILPNNLESLGISDLPTELFNYAGGPGSSYGDGDTFIARAVNTTTSYDNYIANTSFLQSVPEGGVFALSNFWNKLNGLKGTLKPEDNPPADFYAKLGNLANQIEFSNAIPTEEGVTLYQEQVGSIRNEFNSIEDLEGNTTYLGNTQKYSQLLKNSIAGLDPILQDFRQNTAVPNPLGLDYNNAKVNIASRIGVGNPGARKDRSSINTVFKEGQDKVNMIPLYTDATNPFETSAYGAKGTGDTRDLIKFAFEVIDNDAIMLDTGRFDNKKNPIKDVVTTKVHFRAFLTNFSDNHSADWSGKKYMGRGENFYTYQGFDREVSFQFKVAAQSKQEMLPLYQKLNYIVSSLYPDYNSDGFMRGNLHKLTIGEYFYRTPGVITSMNITVDDNYPWEIKFTEPEVDSSLNRTANFPNPTLNTDGSDDFQKSNSDADQMELPQVLNVQVSFKPILNELPSLSKHRGNFNNDQKGILISNDVGVQENFINRIYNKPKDFTTTFSGMKNKFPTDLSFKK
jgi:hypothetical protein